MAEAFRGEFYQKVDSKARVSIPAAFRRILEAEDPVTEQNPRARVYMVYGGKNRRFVECYSRVGADALAAKIEAMYVDLLGANVDVVWVPDLNSLTLLNHSVKVVDGLPAICLNESPLTSRPTAALSKSLVEKGVALLAIRVAAKAKRALCLNMVVALAKGNGRAARGPVQAASASGGASAAAAEKPGPSCSSSSAAVMIRALAE